MTNKENVKQIYQTARTVAYGGNYWCVIHTLTHNHYSMNSILGVSSKSSREAWSHAWKQCQEYMLDKLES